MARRLNAAQRATQLVNFTFIGKLLALSELDQFQNLIQFVERMPELFGDFSGMGDGLTDGRGGGGTEIGGFGRGPGLRTAEFGLARAFWRGFALRLALGFPLRLGLRLATGLALRFALKLARGLRFGRRIRRGGRFRGRLGVVLGVSLARVLGQRLGRRRRDFLWHAGSGRFIEMRLAEVAGGIPVGIRLGFSESRMNGGFFHSLGRVRKLLGRRFGGRFGFVPCWARPAGATTAAATTAATSPRAASRAARRGG